MDGCIWEENILLQDHSQGVLKGRIIQGKIKKSRLWKEPSQEERCCF